MRFLRDIPVTPNAPVLVRSSLNVPVLGGEVANTYRLRRAAETLEFLAGKGARVIVISHIGEAGTETLTPVASALSFFLKRVSFFPESTGLRARDAVRTMAPGSILVLENLRRHKGETANDPAFAKELASLADLFVQDAFDTCHRSHASIVGVPYMLPSYAGAVLEEEITGLSPALRPASPSLAIIGGAKFSTKEPVLLALLARCDKVFVSGALANDFLKAKGYGIGKSLISNLGSARLEPMLKNKRLMLPTDARVTGPDGTVRVVPVTEVGPEDIIVDHGPETSARIAAETHKAKTIIWNGPLGNYEKGFTEGSAECARAIAGSKAHSIVGGGDTVAVIEKLGLAERFSFLSTGGGAMLDFLAKGTLPGIKALD